MTRLGPSDSMYRALLTLVRQLTVLIDSGLHDAVSVLQVKQHVRERDALQWLHSLDQRFEISIFQADGGIYALETREWFEGLDRQLNANCPEDYGTVRRGLCFLFALTVEQLCVESARMFDLYEKRLARADQSALGDLPRQH